MDIPPSENKTPQSTEGVGPLFGIIIIVLLLAAGGIYFFVTQAKDHAPTTPADQAPANS
jgi:hypothetical protein